MITKENLGDIIPFFEMVFIGMPDKVVKWGYRKRGEDYQNLIELPLFLDVANHSPTGFEWGYEGSGPTQLALAILLMHLQDDVEALAHYQSFKRKVIANFERDKGWELTASQIDEFLKSEE